jgi:hypothetical protein
LYLTGRRGRWSADTLQFPFETFYTRLAATQTGRRYLAVIRPEISADGRPGRSEFFLARWTGPSTRLTQISKASQPAIRPELLAVGGRLVASWEEGGRVQVRVIADTLGAFHVLASGQYPTTSSHQLVRLSESEAVLFTQDHVNHRLNAVYISGDSLSSIGGIHSETSALEPFVVPTGPRGFLYLSGRLTPGNGESLADSFFTRLRILC